MVSTGFGLFASGLVVSIVGLTGVFVPSDLAFLGVDAASVRAAGDRLLPFIAHDRAGFGGALMAAGAAVALLSAWGWRRGESWVWWTLLAAGAIGFLPAVAVHVVIGYTDFWHLAPVYLGVVLTAVALTLSRPLPARSLTAPEPERLGSRRPRPPSPCSGSSHPKFLAPPYHFGVDARHIRVVAWFH